MGASFSFIHGYTDTLIKFLKRHPEVDRELSLMEDCVTKEDLQAQEDEQMMGHSEVILVIMSIIPIMVIM